MADSTRESTDDRPSKKPRLGHVTLAQDVDVDDTSQRLIVVGHCVREDVAQKSGLLAGLAQSDGFASLPDDLSPQDVQLWQVARKLGLVQSTDELVTVLKVADVLGDTDQAAWVDMLAQRVAATQWQDKQSSDAMLCALLALPPHLLHRCLTACIPLWPSLPTVFSQLPVPLQQPVAVACAADGSIQVPTSIIDALLVSLLTATIPRPGLRALEITTSADNDGAPHCVTPAQAALLARTLSAHSSLTKVALHAVQITPQSLERFAACLSRGALPQLVRMTIKVPEQPDGIAALFGCLKHLGALTHLSVKMQQHQAPGASSLDSLLRSASSPAGLPNLRRLVFQEESDSRRRDQDDGLENQASCIPAFTFLPLLNASGLTGLSLATKARCASFCHLWSVLAQITSLQKLSVSTSMRDGTSCPPLVCAASGDVVIPGLVDVSIRGRCRVSPLLVAASAARAAPQMTSLAIRSLGVYRPFTRETTFQEVSDAWDALLPAVAQSTGLQNLHLGALRGISAGEPELSYSMNLASALSPLTALTRLHLSAILEASHPAMACRLHGQHLGGALAALTALQSLRLCCGSGKLHAEEPQHVLDACADLAQLSWLGLCMHTDQEVQLAELVPKVNALQHLTIGGSVLSQAGGSIEAVQACFPAVTCEVCVCKPEA